MGDTQDLLAADAARREAMISGNASELAKILSDDLVWTHSSGRTDDKAAVLQTIEAKAVVYLSLQVDDAVVSQHNDIFICHGTLQGRVSKDGAERDLRNKFLSIWKRADDSFQMLAWQSTGF
jgi:ketosteroid isomerase-like protein